jgi:hypothetical protein
MAALSISCSCLVSFSSREVEQFSFECLPLVQEIFSAIHYLPLFGGGLSTVFVSGILHWGFISLPCPLSLGQVQYATRPLLSRFYHSLLFVFQFYGAVQFWMVFSGSGDELCDPLPSLLGGVVYCPPAFRLHCLSSELFPVNCLLIVQH